MEKREYSKGTYMIVSYPWGLFHGGRALCSDGKVRNLKRISQTADTFFSVPAAVTVEGKTVSGYVTFEYADGSSVGLDGESPIVKFCRYDYGKNAGMLPKGAYRVESVPAC